MITSNADFWPKSIFVFDKLANSLLLLIIKDLNEMRIPLETIETKPTIPREKGSLGEREIQSFCLLQKSQYKY